MDELDEDAFYSVNQLLMDEAYSQAVFQQQQQQELHHDNNKVGRRQLNLHHKRLIVDNILALINDNTLPRGTQSKLANQFGVHRSTINRILKDIITQRQRGKLVDVRSKKFGKTGPKPREYNDEWLQSVPPYLRTIKMKYAGALKISHVTVHRLKRKGRLGTHTSNNHPSLTQNHKIARMKWVLQHIILGSPTSNPTFVDMNNVIHIDEKWFFLCPETRRFYLLPIEEDPCRCQLSKRFKLKAMFMALIGRPLYDNNHNVIHDGKYEIFPFVFEQRAKNKSKNRAACTVEKKAVQHITKDVIRDMLLTKVIPTIVEKWPATMEKKYGHSVG